MVVGYRVEGWWVGAAMKGCRVQGPKSRVAGVRSALVIKRPVKRFKSVGCSVWRAELRIEE